MLVAPAAALSLEKAGRFDSLVLLMGIERVSLCSSVGDLDRVHGGVVLPIFQAPTKRETRLS